METLQAPAEGADAEGLDQPEGLGGDEASEAPEQPVAVDSSVRLAQVAARLRRELTPAVTAAQVANPISAVYVVGARLPGLEGSMIDEIPVSRLDVFPEGSALTEDERQRLAAAYGVALGAMGGSLVGSQLRREELRFTGRFERIELPLAVCCLMLFTVLLISWFVLKRRVEFKEADMGTWVSWATAYSVGDPAGDVYSPNLVNADQFAAPVFEFARRAVNGEASAVGDNYAILNRYLRVITDEIEKLETELGRSGDVQQPLSALQASTIVLGVLDDLGADAGRFSIRELNARYVAGRSRTRVDAVTVDLEITFFGDNTEIATTNFSMFRDRLQETPGIVDVEERGSTTLDAGEIERGIAIDGLKITVDPSLVINSEES